MIIKTFVEPPIDNNNYLIVDEETKEAALIDCSFFDKSVIDCLREQNAKLKYILLTHGHFDHVGGINELKIHIEYSENHAKTNVQTVLHKEDLNQIKNVNKYLPMFGIPEMNIPKIDKFVEDGEILYLGNLEIKVLHTPGHTQGGVCYLVENSLFSGDTIFRESVGRCDLEGGDFEQIVESIENKIYTLPENTTIYPGHGKQTTVGWEKIHNRFL